MKDRAPSSPSDAAGKRRDEAALPAGCRMRRLSVADAAALACLEAVAFPPGKETAGAQTWARLLASPGVAGLGVTGPAGGLVAHCIWRRAADEVELLSLAVSPDWRRRGVGGFLLDSLETICRVEGCTMIFLEVAEDNVLARRLYESRGFEEIGRRPGYYRISKESRKDAILMHLSLDGCHS